MTSFRDIRGADLIILSAGVAPQSTETQAYDGKSGPTVPSPRRDEMSDFSGGRARNHYP